MADDGGIDWLGLAGILGAAGLSSAAAIYTNRQQRKFQGNANDTSINLANTAHQREVDDLRAAGLNPILSATGSGAATPAIGVAAQDNPGASLGNSAAAVGRMLSEQQRLSNEQLKVTNKGQRLDNKATEIELKPAQAEARQRAAEADLATLKASLEYGALHDGVWFGNDGDPIKVMTPYGMEISGLYRDRYRSGLKDESNRNWRNNLGTAINSAGTAAQIFGRLRGPRWMPRKIGAFYR